MYIEFGFHYVWYVCQRSYDLSLVGSEVDKPLKILIKTSNEVKYIESNIQNTKAPRIDDPIIYNV